MTQNAFRSSGGGQVDDVAVVNRRGKLEKFCIIYANRARVGLLRQRCFVGAKECSHLG